MNSKIILTLLILTCFSCDKSALFDAGELTSREFLLPNKPLFLESQNIFDMKLIPDTINKIVVTCGSNLQKFVSVSIGKDTVVLSHSIKNSWSRQYERVKLEYHVNQDIRIQANAPLKLFSTDTLHANIFVFADWTKLSEVDVKVHVHTCVLVNAPGHFGSIKASGKSDYIYLANHGSCIINTGDLITDVAEVQQQGSGDIFLQATSQLKVSIESTGNIYYKDAEPKIIIEKQTSSGKLIKQ